MSSGRIVVGIWEHQAGSTWRLAGAPETWEALTCGPRWNAPGTWTISGPFDAQLSRIGKTSLLTFDLVREDLETVRLMTGRVDTPGVRREGKASAKVEAGGADVMAALSGVAVWPDPAAALSAQPQRYVAAGPAETVLRTMALGNLARLGLSVSAAASAGRGDTVHVRTRFGNLLDLMTRKARRGGIGFHLGLVNTDPIHATLTLSFSVPVDRSQRAQLTSEAGTLSSWSSSQQRPTGTRAIVAGGGKGTDRTFRSVVIAHEETNWFWPAELFVDARETTDPTELDEKGHDALDEAVTQSSFELESAEVEGMRLGQHFYIGDTITVSVLPKVTETIALGSAEVSAGSTPLTIKLIPGDPDGRSVEFRQAAIIRALRERIRGLEQEEG